MSVFHQTAVATTPLPLPTHFSHAQQSFSLKKRRLPFSSCTSSSSQSPPWPLSHSLPPHPPSKGCPPLSRVFPHRPSPWKPLSRSLIEPPPPRFIYDPSRPQSFFSQCFTNLGLIGRGSFGEVFKVLSLLDGRHYAVKRSVQRFRGEGERARSIKEARNHEGLRPHPHVLGFVAAWEEGGHLYIQTELCCTSLIQHAEEKSSHTGEASAWSYLCDMLSALDHLHAQGFAHLDLKPANIFITKSGRLKLGDFGLLLHIPTGVRKRASEGESELEREQDDLQEGDPRYMAPELLRGEYGTAADIFSLGVSILELACNIEIPKGGEGWQHLRQGYLPAEYTNVLSAELQCVLKHMLSPEPRDRATAQQLVGLPSVCKHMWRRQLTLCVTESFLSLFHFCQSIFTAGWNIISSLNLPFIHLCASATPCTPPRERWERDGDVSALQHSTIHTDFDSPTHDYMFPPEGPDHSPTFSHGVQARSSVGSTSTPLPNMNKHIRGRDAQTHTPSTSPSHTLTSSPSLSPFHSSHYSSLDHLSDSPSSSKSHSQNLNRSWSRTEQSTKTNFEPKNLLNLFDETIDRPLSSDP